MCDAVAEVSFGGRIVYKGELARMKKWFTGFSMCWGMFCAIPNPIRRWDSGCYRQMLLCLPFLGGVLGAYLGDRLAPAALFGPPHFCPCA